MNGAIQKIAELDHVIVDVNVQSVQGQTNFVGFCTLNTFDPSKMIDRGGPVTKKTIKVQALGDTYDDAYSKVLNRAVELMGL